MIFFSFSMKRPEYPWFKHVLNPIFRDPLVNYFLWLNLNYMIKSNYFWHRPVFHSIKLMWMHDICIVNSIDKFNQYKLNIYELGINDAIKFNE